MNNEGLAWGSNYLLTASHAKTSGTNRILTPNANVALLNTASLHRGTSPESRAPSGICTGATAGPRSRKVQGRGCEPQNKNKWNKLAQAIQPKASNLITEITKSLFSTPQQINKHAHHIKNNTLYSILIWREIKKTSINELLLADRFSYMNYGPWKMLNTPVGSEKEEDLHRRFFLQLIK